MRSLMEFKKKKKHPHMGYPFPPPSFSLSRNLLCIIGLCFCVSDMTEGGLELEMQPCCSFFKE